MDREINKYMIKAFFSCVFLFTTCYLFAQEKATVTVDANAIGAAVSKELHGVFFEEISHAGEGGIYAELIQNRGFEDANIPTGMRLEGNQIVPPSTPHFMLPNNTISDWKMDWSLTSDIPA